MRLIEVQSKKDKNLFLDTARIIYKNDPNWVCPLDTEVESVFDPLKNIFFTFGEACRWILLDNNNHPIGRVAAFINKKKAYTFQQPTGGMGFFECINDQKAAFTLFDTCRNWMEKKGMKAMDGPINFGENDRFWGLLTEGFMPPGIGMPYNHSYYKDFFEGYGFKFYFEQVSNHLSLTKPFPERFWKIAEWIQKKPEYIFRHFENNQREKFVDDFVAVYNEAWAFHENFTPIVPEDLNRALREMRTVLEEEFIWFVYSENKPIAFLIMFPDINQILIHLNGKMHLWNKIRFMYYKKRKTITRARIVIMGVVPQFQKSGVESAIFWNLQRQMDKRPQYSELELSWVGDFNPKMRQLHESVGAVFAKRHITYRCIFAEDIEFTRSTIIPVDTKEKALKNKKEEN
jgi:hypothetical protein